VKIELLLDPGPGQWRRGTQQGALRRPRADPVQQRGVDALAPQPPAAA
jgi:hypothetical protein